jgi:hypothetical protein
MAIPTPEEVIKDLEYDLLALEQEICDEEESAEPDQFKINQMYCQRKLIQQDIAEINMFGE